MSGKIERTTSSPIIYRLELEDGRLRPRWLGDKPVSTFLKPVTCPGIPKLYVIGHAGAIIYVGYTRQPVASRLRLGFEAQGEHGYWGYSWKALPYVDLLIWCFPSEERKTIETVEAEVVYLVRKNTGQWPSHQTEIHFHDSSSEQRSLAQNVYQAYVDYATSTTLDA